MELKELKKYLYAVYSMESSIYMMDNLLDSLINERNNYYYYQGESSYDYYEAPKFFEFYEDYLDGDEGCSTAFGIHLLSALICAIIGFVIGIIYRVKPGFFSLLFSDFLLYFAIGGFILPFLINILFFIIRLIKNKSDNRYIDYRNKVIESNNTITISECQNKAKTLQKEIDKLTSIRNATNRELNQFYALNIIYPKYRSLIPISSFYDYIESGKCNSLTGPGGCYAVYDLESRLDHIMTKLDDIIYRLDDIRDNQYMLYTAVNNSIKESNRYHDSIIQSINNNSALIEENNRYSKITAQNTEFFKWYEFFKA